MANIVVSMDQVDRVIEYVKTNLEVVNLFLDTRFNSNHLREEKLKVFNKVMGEFGIVAKRESSMTKGESTERLVVDYDKVVELAKSEKLRDLVDKGLQS